MSSLQTFVPGTSGSADVWILFFVWAENFAGVNKKKNITYDCIYTIHFTLLSILQPEMWNELKYSITIKLLPDFLILSLYFSLLLSPIFAFIVPDFPVLFFLFLAFVMSRLLPQLQIWEQIIQQIFLPGRYLSLILDYFFVELFREAFS